MTDNERIGKLAERFDPFIEPPVDSAGGPLWAAHFSWCARRDKRDAALAIATPGARLGAAVDLFDFALAKKGWTMAVSCEGDGSSAVLNGPDQTIEISHNGTAVAALLAAMEDL